MVTTFPTIHAFFYYGTLTITAMSNNDVPFTPFTVAGTPTTDDFEFIGMFDKPKRPPRAPVQEQALPVPRPVSFKALSAPVPPQKRLGVFSQPAASYLQSQTGLVHGRVCFYPRNRVQPISVDFCLQDANNQDDRSISLMARKEKRRYCIYDASKGGLTEEDWNLVATLERREFHNDAVSFALTTTADNTLDACVFFNKPRLIQYALQGAPRQLEFGVFTQQGRKLQYNQAIQVVQDCCKYSESKATSSDYKIIGDSRYMNVFQSVVPYKKPGHKKFGLNFHGRGRGASNKNCQMLNEVGRITLQMAKYEKNIYHVDYKAPLNAVQAFGFALAQLDL